MKLYRHLAALAVITLAPAIACAQPQQHESPAEPPTLPRTLAPRPTTAAITQQDLMSRLYQFADDSMQGRDTGSPGFVKATDYIARELERIGLQPAGDNGTYFQRVPLARRTIDPATSLTVGGQSLVLGKDFAPVNGRGVPRAFDGAMAIYGGQFGAPAGITAEQAAGKVVVYALPDGGLTTVPRLRATDAAASAAAVFLVGLERVSPAIRERLSAPSVGLPAATQPASAATPFFVLVSRDAAGRLLGADWAKLKPGTTGIMAKGEIVLAEEELPARNVVAVLPGSDPVLKHQYVAIGAHSDHVGMNGTPVDHDSLRAYNRAAWVKQGAYAGLPALTAAQRASIKVNVDSLRALRPARLDSIYNGADDDGSGSMGVLEIAEALAAMPRAPKRSVLFVWHAGEERGLLGSRYAADNLPVPRDSVVAQLNVDMIGRGSTEADTRGGQPGYVSLVGSRRLSTQLGDVVEEVNAKSTEPLYFDYGLDADGHPENIYCRSDHYNYARWGVPVVFFFTGLHGDYHQVTDEPQYIDYPHYARITRFINALTLRLANDAERPVVDRAKPDPNGACRQ